jgi:hypothetical protein
VFTVAVGYERPDASHPAARAGGHRTRPYDVTATSAVIDLMPFVDP